MTDTKALSDSWRVNRSTVKAIELANAIRALSKVVGSVHKGKRHSTIAFNTEAQSYNQQSDVIRIDPTFASKSLPITSEDFDVLCGHAAHEAGHSLVDSVAVFRKGSEAPLRTDHNKIGYAEVARVGEEIVVDYTVGSLNPVLGDYIRRGRKAYSVPRSKLNWADIIVAWTAVAVYGHLPNPDAPTRVLSALKICMTATQKLRTTPHLPIRARILLYDQVAEELKRVLKQDKIEQKLTNKGPKNMIEGHTRKQLQQEATKELYDTSEEPSTPEDATTSEDENTVTSEGQENPNTLVPPDSADTPLLPSHSPASIPEELQDQITSMINAESSDISDEIHKVMAKYHMRSNDLSPVVWQLSQEERTDEIDDQLYRELVWLRNLKHNIGQEVFRAEPHGIIDQHRIHRATIDGLVFKQKRRRPRKDLELVLLLDASDSMRGENSIVFKAAHTLHRIIPASTIITYNKHRTITMEVSSSVGKPSRKVSPTGMTPSGTALLATAKRFPQALIIHFTDGFSNHGPDTKQAYTMIEKEYPNTSFIEVQYGRPKPTPKGTYPEMVSLVSLDTISEFPTLLREVIKPWALG